jgi:outer membrane protein assembly factor BamA
MRYLRFLLLSAACVLAIRAVAGNAPYPDGGNAVDETNVNSRYTVESIDVAGQHDYTLSQPVLQQIHGLVGTRLDFEALSSLARAINREVHARGVSVRVLRGSEPEYVRVILDVNEDDSRYDISVPKFLWNSREGWTAEGQATGTFGNNSVSFGLLSNGDDLLERYAGYDASFQRRSLGSDKVNFALTFEDYHQEWNRATIAAATGSEPLFLYRSRRNVEPELTYLLSRNLEFSAGVSMEAMQPETAGAREKSANSVTGTVRYHKTVESSSVNQAVAASYSVRAANRDLGSDFVYTRHRVKASYTAVHNRHQVEVDIEGGAIVGTAPMFERFALGDSSTLQGWDKFNLDPLGGTRVMDGSLAYKYRALRVFYDTGAVWDRGGRVQPKQSLGAGLEGNLGILGHNEFLLALAFPLDQGHLEPMLVAGMNF